MFLLQDLKTFEQALIATLRALDRVDARRAHRVIPLRSAASLRSRLAEPRRHEPLVLEPIERRIKCAGRRAASRPFLDLVSNGDAIGIVAETHDREQHDLLELSEIRVPAHFAYIVGQTLFGRQGAPTRRRRATPRRPRSARSRSPAPRAPQADKAAPRSARRMRRDPWLARRRSRAASRAATPADR